MVPVIRLSERTWLRLKAYARPLEDKPDDVVSRALDALDKSNRKIPDRSDFKSTEKPKLSRGLRLAQSSYRQPILEVLARFGGRANVQDIRPRIYEIIQPKLGEHDLKNVSTGDPRWWNAACWERNAMVNDGILRSDSPRGIWEIMNHRNLNMDQGASGIVDSKYSVTWLDDVLAVLRELDRGDGATLSEIYSAVRARRFAENRSAPDSSDAIIRRTLEENCSETESFKGQDIFRIVNQKGDGVWGLRKRI